MTTIISDKTAYELYQIKTNERVYDESELKQLINNNDRYHVVDYSGRTIATAKTRQKAIEQSNRVCAFSPECVIDEKNLIAYNIKWVEYGAGHTVNMILESRY